MNVLNGKVKKGLFSSALTVFSATVIWSQTFSGGGFTIQDGAARDPLSCSTIVVSGITSNVGVRSVTVSNLNHTYLGDTQTSVFKPNDPPPSNTNTGFGTVISSPPNLRDCNFFGTYRYQDMAAQSVDAATTTPSPCNDAYNLPPGDYRTSAYGGGDFTPGPVTSLYTLFGVLTPGQVNGNWLVCVFDYSPGDTGTVGGTSIFFGAPTAASVTIGGRVLNSEGRGIVNVRVNMTLPNHSIRSVLTGKGGIYQFDNVEVGSVYFLTAVSKNYIFEMPTRVVSLTDAVSDLNFVGTLPHKRQ